MFERGAPVAAGHAPAPSRAAKLAGALAVFVLLVGGYAGLKVWAWSDARLPGTTGRGGACELWFVGSSTFGRWQSLERDMRPWSAVNRGVNSAQLGQLARRFAQEPPGGHPAAIILYGGENDIAFGKSAGEAFGDLERLVAEKRAMFGATPLLLLSLKLAPARVGDRREHDLFDAGTRALAAQSPDLRWIDVGPLTLVNGRPGPFFVADGIHLNGAGYRLWQGALHQALARALPPALVAQCTGRPA